MRARVLVVAALLLVAGCGGQANPGATTDAAETSDATTVETTTGPANPWQSEQLTVAVQTGAYTDPGYVAAVRRATAYWNDHAAASAYDVELSFERNASNPDVVVEYTSRLQVCGGETSTGTFYSCTDTYDSGETEQGTSTVELAGGYTANATERIATRAFARLLSVSDGDEPADFPELSNPANRDPWPEPGPVVVSVDQTAASRNVTPLVEQAVAYWERDGVTKNYTADFRVAPNASNPDVVVRFEPNVTSCGVESGTSILGCAPVFGVHDRTYEQETIEIETGYTDESTLETLKHEFGHLHGRLHGQAPMPLMNATSDATRLPIPDARTVAYPWRTTNVSVAVEGEPTEFEQEQVDAALGYFESGAEGFFAAETPSFARTQNASAADIVITVSDDGSACGDGYGGGSCGSVRGYSTDADDALEYYTEAEITTANADEDSVAWHVGYWLAYAFGAQDGEFPEPLDGQNDDRDGRWWE
ncbi:peptidase M10 family protein [Halobacterium hubeiense]|uniref:Peptidase M10 family protein n=1 Tax=Halobacterium hubeiense TaxID=1407499 RepID=A0A0U5H355_9EURY|nr:hypothetical protein [Halobacterium hubeiense]CQH59454.1 peptidase M10 family protein [Halobacterium hubeiense]